MNPKYKPTPEQISTYIAIEKCVSFGNDKWSQEIRKQYIDEAIKVLYKRNYMKDYRKNKRTHNINIKLKKESDQIKVI